MEYSNNQYGEVFADVYDDWYHDLDPVALRCLLAAYAGTAPAPSIAAIAGARWLFEAVWWGWVELKRGLEGIETELDRDARCRLERRLELPPG